MPAAQPCPSRFDALVSLALALLLAPALVAQSRPPQAAQPVDEEYTRLIKQHTQDPRIITELVDHLPASATVPSPLKVLGRIPGTPDELTYSKDIYRYFDTLDQASDRVRVFRIGTTEEGREMIAVVIADEATIRNLAKYKAITAQLTDPRRTSEATARQLVATGRPIYYVTGAIHSPETGSPEMLMELGYRLAVEETPFIQQIRNTLIVVLTPIVEVDGRDKQVDSWYFRKRTGQALPLSYWGKYVAHDNNRDGMAQALRLTQNLMAAFLDWHPTVFHDLHESVPYLYTSTGTGPYNTWLDPLVTDEWWMLAKYEVAEMTKRGVPGVWTWGFYDGWVPNYLFFIANTHNSIGRFYETQTYGPMNQEITLGATQTSREWFRPNPPLQKIKWGPRNNVNMQQSALLFAMSHVAKNREMYLENYWFKNKRAIDRGKAEAPHAWVIPANQRRRVEAAELVNVFRRQGVEVHTAAGAFTIGDVAVNAGDYVIRMDQPYRTLVAMLMDVQFFAPGNPRPYDDTGWTFPYLRNVKAMKVADKAILDQPMTLMAGDAKVAGTISGTGPVLVVEHTTDNTLISFRFAHKDVRILAAEDDFEAAGRTFRAGAFIVPDANRAALEPTVRELGLSAWAMPAAPAVKTHELDVPRIGYVHAWQRTQDEGWVRLAFDAFGVPYTYFADQKLREGNLRAKYDVIVFPHVGGTLQSHLNGVAGSGRPLPYKKTPETPNLGAQDESDDIRGGMGLEGFMALVTFVREGGTLIVEGSTSTLFPAAGVTSGVTLEEPTTLFARGSILKALFTDRRSPIAYGYDQPVLPVYFNQGPVFRAGSGGVPGEFAAFMGGGPQIPGVGMNTTPNAVPPTVVPLEPEEKKTEMPSVDEAAAFRQMARAFGMSVDEAPPRVILRFPRNANDMLLSGSLVGGQALADRAVVIDAPVGNGHVVMFATRPYWRWQTQGLFFLGFNAILNWNDLDAGKEAPKETSRPAAER
ncbi:MAG: Zinc carboxypeptidase [Acidobacteria bacterium]|nr:Zinc carboxypeptidase [Acidobacteriota bacterium]